MRLAFWITLVVAAMLAGCADVAKEHLAALQAAEGDPQQQLAIIKDWKAADLAAAEARAIAGNDKIAAICFHTLQRYVASPDATIGQSLKFAGAWDAFEAARLGIKGATSGSLSDNPVLQDLQIGCAPLVGDIRLTLIRLGIMGGAAMMK